MFLYGGARSGKSLLIALYMIQSSLDYSGLRSLVARLRFNSARSSIWHETFLPLIRSAVPRGKYNENKTEFYVQLDNGSEIWLGGFDEKERTEKLLGHEYNLVYFNEVSEIGYDAVELGLSRLAKRSEGFSNRAFFDCNPPSPLHWSHKLFLEGVDPKNPKRKIEDHITDYWTMMMNPADNADNLDPNYFRRFRNMSDRMRRRMEFGEFVKAEGVVYERFDIGQVVKEADLPLMERYTIGLDFGLNMAAVLVGWCGDSIYIIEDYGAYDSTSAEFNSAMRAKWGDKIQTVYCDPSGGERLQEISNSMEANNSVEPGIDAINSKIAQGRFFVCEKATGFLSEVWDYRRDEKERIVKQNDHYMDAARYGIFSEIAEPLQIFIR